MRKIKLWFRKKILRRVHFESGGKHYFVPYSMVKGFKDYFEPIGRDFNKLNGHFKENNYHIQTMKSLFFSSCLREYLNEKCRIYQAEP